MKKILLLLPFIALFAIANANAQCQSAAAGTGKACCASKLTGAAKAAASDPTIEQRKAEDGTVSYVRKETTQTGAVNFVNVQYDAASNTFVNVATKAVAEGDKAGAAKKAGCCAGGDKKTCSPSEKKACAGGTEKKACAGEATQK
ncbi:MAG: hypothetical protein J0L99_06860 [Chitinophagales bacterium]|nr:hypothetical protein [Chitinophagales bacterium]